MLRAVTDHSGTPKPFDIGERTFQFACAVVHFCRSLPRADWVAQAVARQLLRAGTGIGANVEEAKAAYSRREFACKNGIALKESRETTFWLRLMETCGLAPESDVRPLHIEAREILAILTVIVRKSRNPPSP
ncbi:MAG TPA: four helix bundle protein [Vicinamibacterales bacterium]|nr:four helix bundle protein [Vicinamibacterales bacterium]